MVRRPSPAPPPRFTSKLFPWGIWFAAAAILFPGGSRSAAGPVQATSKAVIYGGWFGSTVPTPSFVADHFDFLESRPFNGLAIYLRNPSLTVNASLGVMANSPMSYADISTMLDPVRNLPFTRLRDNFGYVVGHSPPDFFDDWTIPIQNFANLAHALKDAGMKGIFFDNEQYFNHWAEYPGGVAYPATTLDQYQTQARLRGKEVMEAMVAEFPEIVVLSLHGPYVSEPDAPFQLAFPLAVARNLLMGPFFVGFFEGRGAQATVVDGGEFYGIRDEGIFSGNRTWRKNDFASDTVNCTYLPPPGRPIWPSTIQVSFGVYDLPFGGNDMNPSILTPTLQNALNNADRYVWFYTEGATFLKPESQGGAPQAWVDAVFAANPSLDNLDGGGGGGGSSGCGLLGFEAVPLFLFLGFLRSRGRRNRR